MQTGFIYGLYDVRDSKKTVRYVGQTRQKRGVTMRIYGHVHDSKTPVYPVSHWISAIKPENLSYITLSQPQVEDLDADEIWFIAKYRSMGQADLNVAEGGQGLTSKRAQGENNPKAKLTQLLVDRFRELSKTEYVSTVKLAEQLGVTSITVSKFLTNYTWYDADYDPSKRKTVSDTNKTDALVWRSLTDDQVNNLRREYLDGVPGAKLSKKYNIPATSRSRYLFEKYGDEELRLKCVAVRPPVVNRSNKVTPEERIEILKRYESGEKQKDIARDYGITQSGVSAICKMLKLN